MTDNTTAIQNTFNYAAANNCAALIPAGNFAYSGTLTANGIAITGIGAASILTPLDVTNSAIILTGNGGSISKLVTMNSATTRLTAPQQEAIWVNGATNYTIQNVLIDGGASGGIMSSAGSSSGKILNNTVENTLADSITQVEGASNITVQGNLILNAGDDAISNNSYVGYPLVSNITIQGNTVLNDIWGHPTEVSGGSNITISGNYFDNPDGYADIYISSDLPVWNTQGINTVTISGNTLVAGSVTNEGTVIVYNDSGSSYSITGVTISGNQFVNPVNVAVQYAGNGSETGVTEDNTAYMTGTFGAAENSSPISRNPTIRF